jgi:hypothetical protein
MKILKFNAKKHTLRKLFIQYFTQSVINTYQHLIIRNVISIVYDRRWN